jgi:16S rRNA (cytidine1402-2'-O)-methyltransferase
VPGRLILCATPIGNLDDVPARLGKALEAVDVVYAEDTRRSRVLLGRLGVDKPLRSYFVGNEESRAAELRERLAAGDTAALLTDAGMPSIADPGLTAVRAAIEAGADVTIVPGPSAVTAALAVSGLPADRFAFEGFLPRKAGPRRRRVEALAHESRTIVLFATPSRVVADLEELTSVLGESREVAVVRELTKAHEEIFRGSLADALYRWSSEVEPRGEFTLVVAGTAEPPPPLEVLLPEVAEAVAAGGSLSEVVRDVAKRRGVSRRELYEAALKDRDGA